MKPALSLMVLAILLPIYGQEKSSQSSSDTASSNELKKLTPKTQPTPSPTNINVLNEQAPDREENRAKEHPKCYLSRLFAPENLPNIGLLFAGIVGIIVAICTLKAIERQADLMESSLVAVQRAFVFPKGVESTVHIVDAATNKTTEWHLWIPWENSGLTPTKALEIHVNWLSQKHPLPKGYDFPDLDPKNTLYVLGPKATTSCGPLKIPAQDLVGVKKGTHHLYIWGRATYRDVFKQTITHVTKFCWKITDVLGDPTSDKVVIHFAAHDEHNCADED
jgi:hypothetical protein